MTAKANIQSKWQDLRTAMDSHFAELRAKGERHRAERDLKRADDPELDATEATDFAIYALDCAESAIVDATIARADADALETT